MLKIQELKLNTLDSYQIVDWAYTDLLEPDYFNYYQKWLSKGLHGPLNYLANDWALKRESLKGIMPKCKSALVFLFSHLESKKYLIEKNYNYQIASFVFGYHGYDYHYYIKKSLNDITQKYLDGSNVLICVDTMPIMERDLACRAGLGFIGKNNMLIHSEFGPYNMIGTILLDHKLDLSMRKMIDSKCADCINCLQGCPTGALASPYTLDATKCISTFTMEDRKNSSGPQSYKKQKYYLGCDKCQDVCPFGIQALKDISGKKNGEKFDLLEEFFLKRELSEIIQELESMSNNYFKKKFAETSIERIGRQGVLNNLLLF